MPNKKNTIRKKLLVRGRIILVLILLMIIASQVVVSILKKTSNEFFIEYNEMNTVQEFKLSLYQLLLQTNKYSLLDNPDDQTFFMILIHQANEKLMECQQVITESHDSKILSKFPQRLIRVENLAQIYFSLNKTENNHSKEDILNRMNEEITDGLKQIDILLIEIKTETAEYNKINSTVFNHSSLAILALGIIIFIIFIVGGLRFINNLTQPIFDLVSTTKRIISGERGIKVSIDTEDEFSILADSFNQMLDSLETTTVSKTYLDNILKNMFDSLIVTDRNLVVRSVNDSTSKLIGMEKSTIEGQSLSILFDQSDYIWKEERDIQEWKNIVENMVFMRHNSDKKIPVLITCAFLMNDSGDETGLVIVAHDLTLKKEIEKKLEQSRKQRQIDINEVQEEERMRIATDLHDGLGQMLTAVSYSSQEFHNIDNLTEDEKEELINKIQSQIHVAIKESKNLAHNLIPIVLKDFGLLVAIQNLIDKANEMYNISFSFNAFDFNERINAKLEKSLYRICQEALNNIVKHSRASNVNYQIFNQGNMIVLVIDDDGIGFDVSIYEEKSDKGIGLISMRERVQAFGGALTIDSQIGVGTEILIEIPCKQS